RREDGSVDEALLVGVAAAAVDGLAVGVELEQIVGVDQLRRPRPGHDEAPRILGMANADVAIGVEDALTGEQAIGNHDIAADVAHRLTHTRRMLSFPFARSPTANTREVLLLFQEKSFCSPRDAQPRQRTRFAPVPRFCFSFKRRMSVAPETHNRASAPASR